MSPNSNVSKVLTRANEWHITEAHLRCPRALQQVAHAVSLRTANAT